MDVAGQSAEPTFAKPGPDKQPNNNQYNATYDKESAQLLHHTTKINQQLVREQLCRLPVL